MRTGQPLGLDELMIVNPGLPDVEAVFLSDDGQLYQVVGLGGLSPALGRYILAEDGILYPLRGFDLAELAGGFEEGGLGHYLIGSDGALYEIVDEA